MDHHSDDSGAGHDLRDHAAPLRSRGQRADATRLEAWNSPGRHVVLVPVGGVQRAVVKALRYARTLADDVRAVYVEIDPAATEAVRALWPEWGQRVRLVVLDSPYRSLMEPLLEYIEQIQRGGSERSRHRHPSGVRAATALAAPAAQPARAA